MCLYANSQDHYSIKVHLSNQNVEIFRNGVLHKPSHVPQVLNQVLLYQENSNISYSRKEKDGWVENDGTQINYYYITRFNDANAFHSIPEGHHRLVDEGQKLFSERKPSSMGCIRLKKEDAKWIYDLPLKTSVEVIGNKV